MFYQFLADLTETDDSFICTALDEKAVGEHCLISNGKVIRKTDQFPEYFSVPEDSFAGTRLIIEQGIRFFIEPIKASRNVVICGAGHVALAVIKMLKVIGLRVIVLEDRISFAKEAEKCGADVVMTGDFCENLARLQEPSENLYVIMTRGHRYDMECLEYILKHGFVYAGMMSSKLRVRAAKELMIEKGVSEDRIEQLHSPIGIKIGAETPEEIAVSVTAEIISVLHEKGRTLFTKEIIHAIFDERERVLAEIVVRRGPAPRKAGTKMVIFADGTIAGTIGGGCFEAAVIRTARDMLAAGTGVELITLDLTGNDPSAAEGAACGGVMEVLLEYLPKAECHEEVELKDRIHT